MFKFLPLLIFAFVSCAFAQGYGYPGNSRCAHWCAENFRHPGKTCTYPAAKGKGPCYDCGPRSTNRDKRLCYGVCKNVMSDNTNCGKCGKSCHPKTYCVKGSCVCKNSNKPRCKGECPDYTSDSANCGKCGHACKESTEKCQAGTCVPQCPTGKTQCGSLCVDLKTDPKNCGECDKPCSSGQCVNAACAASSCSGQTCDTFTACGPGGTCVCASISGGTGFCIDGQTPCAGLADCSTTADCATGQVCAVGTCCTRSVCITADTCTNKGLKASFGKVTGATVGRPAGNK